MKFVCLLEIVLIVSCVSISGCSSLTGELVSASQIAPPDSIEADGKTWSLNETMEKAEEEILTAFFTSQPDFQGSTNMAGTPTVFSSGEDDRRFYWLHGDGEAARWSCVRFEEGCFQVSEGTSNPFLN